MKNIFFCFYLCIILSIRAFNDENLCSEDPKRLGSMVEYAKPKNEIYKNMNRNLYVYQYQDKVIKLVNIDNIS